MQGDQKIITALNDALSVELTAINQYFIHSRMLQDRGLMALAKKLYEESIGEMRHADQLIQRILFLEGAPAISRYNTIKVGDTVPKMFANDLAMEMGGVKLYKESIALSIEIGDAASREIMEHILSDSEEHVDWIETQIGLIDTLGLERYLAEHMIG